MLKKYFNTSCIVNDHERIVIYFDDSRKIIAKEKNTPRGVEIKFANKKLDTSNIDDVINSIRKWASAVGELVEWDAGISRGDMRIVIHVRNSKLKKFRELIKRNKISGVEYEIASMRVL